MDIKLWMLKPSELRATLKVRIFNLCDKKGCYKKCHCEECRFCITHFPLNRSSHYRHLGIYYSEGTT